MRRYLAALFLVASVAVGMATVASGATPPFGQRFSGTGGNYWNEGSSWVRHGTGTYRFRISRSSYSSNPYVTNFHGTYTTACSGRTLRLFAGSIRISERGRFSFRFHSSGAYVKIWGVFTGNGRKAKVNFLANFSHSRNYNQHKPGALGCAAWVRGTAHAS